MKKFYFIVLLFFGTQVKGQQLTIDYEWLNVSGGFLYHVESEFLGVNGKFSFPLGPGINFQLQGSFFPSQMQFSENTYDETRAKFNIEIIPVRLNKFYFSLQTGFDYGFWRRNFDVTGSQLGHEWKRDESMMFGALANYNYNSFRFYLDYMYMPQIFSNHIGLGMSVLIFEDSRYRRMYLQRHSRNSNKWWRFRNKGGKGGSGKKKNKG